jgi:hypothetical protein
VWTQIGPPRSAPTLLAFRDPVDVGQAFDDQFGLGIDKKCKDRIFVCLARFARQIGFKNPFLRLVLGHFTARQHNLEIPIKGVFMRDQRRLDLITGPKTVIFQFSRDSGCRWARS